MKKLFNCTEREFFALCLSGWETCAKFIKEISKFSPFYTEAYVKAQNELVMSTLKESDRSKRVAQKTKLRSNLILISKSAFSIWRSLKLYVENSSESRILKENLKEIGVDLYKSAKRQQWEDLLKMLNAGQVYLADHLTTLLENQNMPEGFVEEYNNVSNQYAEAYKAYLSIGMDGKSLTESYTVKLNTLYADLIKMFAVGREVFANDPVIANQFKVTHGLANIIGTGWAGIKGKIFNENGLVKEIEGLEINVLETEDSVVQESDGSFILNHLAAGDYTISILAPGYKSVIKVVSVKVDTYSIYDVYLEIEGGESGDAEKTAE